MVKDFPEGNVIKIEELCKCKGRKEFKRYHLRKWSEKPTEYHLLCCKKHEKKLLDRIFEISGSRPVAITW